MNKYNLKEMEKVMIEDCLMEYRYNKTQSASALGITIKTLYNKLHEYGIFEKYQKHVTAERLVTINKYYINHKGSL